MSSGLLLLSNRLPDQLGRGCALHEKLSWGDTIDARGEGAHPRRIHSDSKHAAQRKGAMGTSFVSFDRRLLASQFSGVMPVKICHGAPADFPYVCMYYRLIVYFPHHCFLQCTLPLLLI